MDEVDSFGEAETEILLQRHPEVDRVRFSVRGSIRVLASLSLVGPDPFEELGLLCFRSLLSAAYLAERPESQWHPILTDSFEDQKKKADTAAEYAATATAAAHQTTAACLAMLNGSVRQTISSLRSSAFYVGWTKEGPHNSSHNLSEANASRRRLDRALQLDVARLRRKQPFGALWERGLTPQPFDAVHAAFLDRLGSDSRWRFFGDWYQDMWEGTWTDWDLALEVAKIDSETWEAGLDAMAAEIEKIEAKWDVIRRLEEILPEKQTVVADRLGIGGNAPPEHIDDFEGIRTSATIIWEGVDALDAETRAKEPSTERVKVAIALLTKGLAACLGWLGRKGDLATDETIKALAKWGAPIGGAYLLANPGKIEALINAAKTWLSFL